MSNGKQKLPRKPMPLGYLIAWLLVAAIWVFYKEAHRHPSPFSFGQIVENVCVSLVTGAVCAWLSWRWIW